MAFQFPQKRGSSMNAYIVIGIGGAIVFCILIILYKLGYIK